LKEALYYRQVEKQNVQCLLCPHFCIIKPDESGFCKNRKNKEGKLYSLNYGKVASIANDPIEKKPLYHYYPGSSILSFGSFGCSFECLFCQNSSISRAAAEINHPFLSPEDCIDIAVREKTEQIAYTYNEPYIWYEHVLETAKLAREKGIRNILVTNGYFNPEPWKELSQFIDALNIDLKGDPDFYHQIVKGSVEPVLKTIRFAFENNIHVEVTFLAVTGVLLEGSFKWVLEEIKKISKKIPFHISRYSPRYRYHEDPTPIEKMKEFYFLAKKELDSVYLGNIETNGEAHTFCPSCGTILIQRSFYHTEITRSFASGKCLKCGFNLYGRFKGE